MTKSINISKIPQESIPLPNLSTYKDDKSFTPKISVGGNTSSHTSSNTLDSYYTDNWINNYFS